MRMEVMPNYLGQKWVDVERSLKRMDLTDEQIKTTLVNDEAPAGEVIAQSLAENEDFNPKDVLLEFTVSEGLGTVDMPDLIGKRLSEVQAILEKSDLKLDPAGPTHDSSFSVPEGQVYHQFPANPGEPVSRGEEIKIWISSGYPEDALSPVKNVEVEPEVEGEPSTVKISIRDAREDEITRDPVEITSTTTFPVTVVVSPNTPAIITILRDDKFYDSVTVSYKDAQDQGAGSPEAMTTTSSSNETDSEGAN
jgi:beta-lactam-binding protein with PASTA domain